MITQYEGNDTYTYTLSSGTEITLTQYELQELTGFLNRDDEFKQKIACIKQQLYKAEKELQHYRGQELIS